jgi:hypothetical protein
MYSVVVILKTGEVYTYGLFQTWDEAARWRDAAELPHVWERSSVAIHTPVVR